MKDCGKTAETGRGSDFVLRGDICTSRGERRLCGYESSYLVCENGVCAGIFRELPERYLNLPLADCGSSLIIPGLTDLHVHAPQYSFRGLGMDLELLDWLDTQTYPEEAKYSDIDYASRAYGSFVDSLKKSPDSRAVIFATVHNEATQLLMDLLEESGVVSFVGRVNMDRNSPESLREPDARSAAEQTVSWLGNTAMKGYRRTYPIITPRFIPSCTDELLERLSAIRGKYALPVQSHLSESRSEVEWVRELCPWSRTYGGAYDRFGLFGGAAPTVMAHGVWAEDDMELMAANGVYVAHCPQSNTNLSSGIAPVRKFLEHGVKVGLGSDIAGGSDLSILKVARSAVEVSKLYWRLIDADSKALTTAEAFYLATAGGGSFFGRVGRFEEGYEFDALVIDDTKLAAPYDLSIADRVARLIYFSDEAVIERKYVAGRRIL